MPKHQGNFLAINADTGSFCGQYRLVQHEAETDGKKAIVDGKARRVAVVEVRVILAASPEIEFENKAP
jgi:hypothetical protein